MTPNHVSTNLWIFLLLTFLLKDARAQHTLKSERKVDTTFKSVTSAADGLSQIRYSCMSNIGAASQKAWTSLNMHKSLTSFFTTPRSTGKNSLKYLHRTPNCTRWTQATIDTLKSRPLFLWKYHLRDSS